MIISYTTFQAAQLLKDYGYNISLSLAEKVGEKIMQYGYDKVKARIQISSMKRDLNIQEQNYDVLVRNVN